MSRIGNRVLSVPSGINVEILADQIVVKNGNNSLVVKYPKDLLEVKQEGTSIKIKTLKDVAEAHMHHGTVNAVLSNALIGLSTGFTKTLELKGVGYKAKVEGNKLNLALGFSHPLNLEIPAGLKVETPSATEIKISGYDKVMVGQFAADVRKYRKPEPYKGKGVLYKGEQIVRKVGKTADKKK